MAVFELIKLRFNSPLHLGKGRSGQYDSSERILHSDTLKSAIFVSALELDKNLEQESNSRAFFEAFTLSSAFPFAEEELFFPKPLGEFIKLEGDSSEHKRRKKAKKIKFISAKYLAQYLDGQAIKSHENYVVDKLFLSTKKSNSTRSPLVFKAEVFQKVTVPRIMGEEDAEPYYIEQLFFREKAGLFFLLNIKNESYREHILRGIEILGERGIGMDRSSGCGFFDFDRTDIEEFSIAEPKEGNHWLNLSLYWPQEGEYGIFKEEDTLYELTKRGGYLTGKEAELSWRKRSVYMLKEGAILCSQTKLKGELNDLQPEILKGSHPVWRDGQPIFLRLKKQQDGL